VVFVGTGGNDASGDYQAGVYTAVGACCQKVADRNTAVPGQVGATFDRFLSTDRNDIDGGRVAFLADVSASTTVYGVYSNVGQASAGSLVEVAVADGIEWSLVSDPWVTVPVTLRGRRLIPANTTRSWWEGADGFLSPRGLHRQPGYGTHGRMRRCSGATRRVIRNWACTRAVYTRPWCC
jgi:hypothetical protein